VLAAAQDRIVEKTFFSEFAETAPWRAVQSADDLHAAIAAIGTPAILKTTRLGYDGKGQVRINAGDDLAQAWASLKTDAAILEGFIEFTGEISVIIARTADGRSASYPPVANVHRHHILHTTTAPAAVSKAVSDEALRIANTAAERLKVVGLLAVEMFVTADERVLVNEMAPRPHNSGHWTMDAADTDQFEQLVRAVAGLPLGSTHQRCPVVMTNLLGEEALAWHDILRNPQNRLHLYGKADPRPGRKMGHINTLSGISHGGHE
jgi:5-(carboxyamino)imidazole ribonucleotide synthase